MKFQYVNPKSVEEFIGKYAPVSAFMLARIIEEALDNVNQGYVQTTAKRRLKSDPPEISKALVGVMDKMLASNLQRGKRPAWEMYDGLDFDLVHEIKSNESVAGPTLSTTVKAYFHHLQYGRPPGQRRVVFHLVYHEIEGTQWCISFPVQIVMKGFPKISDGYMGYSHGIALRAPDGTLGTQFNYIGITKRNWLKRMAEHFNEVRRGSNKTFHAAWRKYAGSSDAMLVSELIINNHTFDQIMGWEEYEVDQQMDVGTSLNMIPGGFKGLKFLHEHRLTSGSRITLEERDAAVETYQILNPRGGVPNLLVSQLWKNQQYAELVICGPEGRLSPNQVRRVRELGSQGISAESIVALVGAKNVLQVERVLSGHTYARIQ